MVTALNLCRLQRAACQANTTYEILHNGKCNGKKMMINRGRMGQGTIYHDGEAILLKTSRPMRLEQQMKQKFDPNGILPALR